MARSVYYYHLSHLKDADKYILAREQIRAIYEKSHGRYGYRRICIEMRNSGILINHKTIQKLMQQLGLKAKRKKRNYQSYKGTVGKIAPNIREGL